MYKLGETPQEQVENYEKKTATVLETPATLLRIICWHRRWVQSLCISSWSLSNCFTGSKATGRIMQVSRENRFHMRTNQWPTLWTFDNEVTIIFEYLPINHSLRRIHPNIGTKHCVYNRPQFKWCYLLTETKIRLKERSQHSNNDHHIEIHMKLIWMW